MNGLDLSNIQNESIDLLAAYSVLHHIPDYLGILKEFMRVLKPGGVIYIDHEYSNEFWENSQVYSEFILEMKKRTKTDWRKYFVLTNYYDAFIRRFVNPRYQREGDIHVFADDHIEWSQIIDSLMRVGGQIVTSKDYLLFRRNYEVSVYNAFRQKTTDMHVLVVRKN